LTGSSSFAELSLFKTKRATSAMTILGLDKAVKSADSAGLSAEFANNVVGTNKADLCLPKAFSD
jgi:hypothetical protein